MLTILGTAAAQGAGWVSNPLVNILIIFLVIYIFLRFCTWARKFKLSGKSKKWIYILTGVGLVAFNVLYGRGNAAIKESGDWSGATLALLLSMVWVFIFAFALMAETKTE